jgi:hypothetical protein
VHVVLLDRFVCEDGRESERERDHVLSLL